jgi:hypothetical protein
MKSLVVLLIIAFVASARGEDWTTSSGTTYHDVKDLGHNTETINISCQEGANVWVQLSDLPASVQQKYRYDAAKEKAMDVYLIRVSPGLPGVVPDPAKIKQYAAQVKWLLANPETVSTLSPQDIYWLAYNRLHVAGYLCYKMAPADVVPLRNDEVRLIGLMLEVDEAKLDASIPPGTLISIQDDSPYANHLRDQSGIKHLIFDFVGINKFYLRHLYHHENDKVSIDADVRPLLSGVGLDATGIDWLVGKSEIKL